MLPKVLSSPASQTSSWSNNPVPNRVEPGAQGSVFTRDRVGVECVELLRCRVTRTGGVPDVRDGVVLASASDQAHFAEPVPAHALHVDLPARDQVFAASRCHILLKAGFGRGSSPIADCVNAASFNGRTSACQADHAGSSLPVTTAAHPQRAPPPRAPAAHPAPAQRAPGSCPAAHPSGACRSAACCQHSCAASPLGCRHARRTPGSPRGGSAGTGRRAGGHASPSGPARSARPGTAPTAPRCGPEPPRRRSGAWGVQMVGIYSGLGAALAHSTPRGDQADPGPRPWQAASRRAVGTPAPRQHAAGQRGPARCCGRDRPRRPGVGRKEGCRGRARARGYGPDRLPPGRAANLGRARWGRQGRVRRYPRCRGRGRGHPRRGPGDRRTPSGRRRRSRPKLHGGGATGPRAARGWHGA